MTQKQAIRLTQLTLQLQTEKIMAINSVIFNVNGTRELEVTFIDSGGNFHSEGVLPNGETRTYNT